MLAASSQAANVALGKKVYASSNKQPPELAVDDNLDTRWESKASDGDNQWFYVDLEKYLTTDTTANDLVAMVANLDNLKDYIKESDNILFKDVDSNK